MFTVLMDRLTDEIREGSLWTLMFAYDTVVCSENKEEVEERLERWRHELERRGMTVRRSKTEHMCGNEKVTVGHARSRALEERE